VAESDRNSKVGTLLATLAAVGPFDALTGQLSRQPLVTDDRLCACQQGELERLHLQAGVWEPETDVMLDRIGVQAGWSCLDMGCGAMGILGPLARRVGSHGRVVGVDLDALLAAAQA
jgi:hypothetical protein